MDLLRKKLAKPLAFVVTSDDPKWCRKNLIKSPDTFLAGTGNTCSPGSDLALLAACNHTIFDYGTYGLTAAMFNSEGHTVIYDTGSRYFLHKFPEVLKNWTKLGNSKSPNVNQVKKKKA